MVEFGEFYDFDKLQMSPAPSPTGAVLRRRPHRCGVAAAARVGDGWTSAMMTGDQLAETIGKLNALRAEFGRATSRSSSRPSASTSSASTGTANSPRSASPTTSSSLDLRRLGFRRPAGQEEGLAEAVRRHLYPFGMAAMTDTPAHGGARSRDAVTPATRKRGWRCSPRTPSSRTHRAFLFDPEGKGHRGQTRYRLLGQGDRPTDRSSSTSATLSVRRRGSQRRQYRHHHGRHQITAEGVFTYKVNDEGKLVALRAYWEMDRAGGHGQPV